MTLVIVGVISVSGIGGGLGVKRKSRLFHVASNTAIAGTTCENGDRWIFVQDDTGQIRGMKSSFPSPSWESSAQVHNFTGVRAESPLSASCVAIPSQSTTLGLQQVPLLTLGYFDPLYYLRQSISYNGSWIADSTLMTPASDRSRLSISTNRVTGNPDMLSSIAVYQGVNESLLTADLAPELIQSMHVQVASQLPNPDFDISVNLTTSFLGLPFAFTFNGLGATSGDLYTRFTVGARFNTSGSPAIDAPIATDYTCSYTASDLKSQNVACPDDLHVEGAHPTSFHLGFELIVSKDLPLGNSVPI